MRRDQKDAFSREMTPSIYHSQSVLVSTPGTGEMYSLLLTETSIHTTKLQLRRRIECNVNQPSLIDLRKKCKSIFNLK